VYEEVTALEDGESRRRNGIVATIEGENTDSLFTLQSGDVETNKNQPLEVQEEKSNIYTKTIPYYSEKFNISKFEVYVILIGSKGTIREKFYVENHTL
jgi:hypothetical protein